MVLGGGRTPHIGTEIVKGPASLGGVGGGRGMEVKVRGVVAYVSGGFGNDAMLQDS